jgi:hypothetical protein
MIAGLALAALELFGLAFGAVAMSPFYWVLYLGAVCVIVFGALYVRTEGFGNQSFRSDAYAIGAGIMIFGFLGVTVAHGGIDRGSFLPLIILAIAFACGMTADRLVHRHQEA